MKKKKYKKELMEIWFGKRDKDKVNGNKKNRRNTN